MLYENILLFDAHAYVYRNTHPKMDTFWGPLKVHTRSRSRFQGFRGRNVLEMVTVVDHGMVWYQLVITVCGCVDVTG